MTIQFFHKRIRKAISSIHRLDIFARGGETIAMETPPSWFVNSLNVGDFFEKKVGKARCSMDDNYCRSVGRELSTQRMKNIKLTVDRIVRLGDIIQTELIDKDGFIYVIRTCENSTSSRFVNYFKR